MSKVVHLTATATKLPAGTIDPMANPEAPPSVALVGHPARRSRDRAGRDSVGVFGGGGLTNEKAATPTRALARSST